MLERQREGIALAKAQGKSIKVVGKLRISQTGKTLLPNINIEKFHQLVN